MDAFRHSQRFSCNWRRWLLALACAVALAGVTSAATAKPIVHTVYKGQRLGSIAKRYNVSIDAICHANGIERSDPIHPGQKLVIPGTDGGKDEDKKKKSSSSSSGGTGTPRIHTVARGHTLSAISGRYAVTVSAICHASGISRDKTLKVGDKLVIPHKNDKDGSYARKLRLAGKLDDQLAGKSASSEKKRSKKSGNSWDPYVKPAWRAGYIKIRRYGRSWEGYVIGPKNQVLGHASNKINYVLGAKDDGPRISEQLIRLIAHVSDKFGGRQMRIVSGYRKKSFVAASKHKTGNALDFSIPGVPNTALRDYLRTLDDVGVGYYPNSSFVHLDVRGYNAYWVDYAGPGEAPKTRKRSSGSSSKKAKSDDSSKKPDDRGDSGGSDDSGSSNDSDASSDAGSDDAGSSDAAEGGKSSSGPSDDASDS